MAAVEVASAPAGMDAGVPLRRSALPLEDTMTALGTGGVAEVSYSEPMTRLSATRQRP